MNKILNKEAIKYLLPLILIIAVGLVFLFVLFPKSNPETTAHGFMGLITSIGNDGEYSFITVHGRPLLDDSTIEPSHNWEERKIIIHTGTQIKKDTAVLPEVGPEGESEYFNMAELEHKITQGSIADFKKGMEVLVFTKKNIYFDKEFTAEKIEIKLYESSPFPQSQ